MARALSKSLVLSAALTASSPQEFERLTLFIESENTWDFWVD